MNYFFKNLPVLTGCKSIPKPKSRYCQDHDKLDSPAICADDVSKETRSKLRSYRKRNANSDHLSQDNVYIIETIIKTDIRKIDGVDTIFYCVKWMGFADAECSWEPASRIPTFLREFYSHPENLGKFIPSPTLKKSKTVGSKKYHLLSWNNQPNEQS